MTDFRVKVTVRNARLLDAIEEKFGTQKALADFIRRPLSAINALVAMRVKPIRPGGMWTNTALDVANALGLEPLDVWPEHLVDVRIKRGAEVRMGLEQVAQVVDANQQTEQRMLLDKMAGRLTARELTAVKMHAEDATYDDIARAIGGISRARASQILARALRKMRFAAKARLGIDSYRDASQ